MQSNTEIKYVDSNGNNCSPLPIIETTITDLNGLPEKSGIYVNNSGFTTNLPATGTPHVVENIVILDESGVSSGTTYRNVKVFQKCYYLNSIYVRSVLRSNQNGTDSYNRSEWYECYDSNGVRANMALKLGVATLGSDIKPIYLNNGTPVESTRTVGEPKIPVYLKEGELTAAADVLNIDDMFNTTMTSVQIGAGADATQNYGVVIGNDATDGGWQYCTVIGDGASIGDTSGTQSNYGIAIGYNAKCVGSSGVQIGDGTNNKRNCIQYRSYIVPHYQANTLGYGTTQTEEGNTFYHPNGYVSFYGYSSTANTTRYLKIAWGAVKLTGSSSSATTVSTNGVTFTSEKTYSVFVSGQGTGNYNYSFGVEPLSSSSFRIKYGSSSAVACRWIAIGY